MTNLASAMEMLIAISAGIALAAACGFRVFLPMLAASIAVRAGYLNPSPGLAWIGDDPVLILLCVATVFEILAYYVPWVDNALDTIATPAAVVAGAIVAATAFGNMDPAIKWTAALIAGGGAAAAIQGSTVLTRALSSATTGGIANPVLSTAEAGSALVLVLLAILLPIVALIAVLLLMIPVGRIIIRRVRNRRTVAEPATAGHVPPAI